MGRRVGRTQSHRDLRNGFLNQGTRKGFLNHPSLDGASIFPRRGPLDHPPPLFTIGSWQGLMRAYRFLRGEPAAAVALGPGFFSPSFFPPPGR